MHRLWAPSLSTGGAGRKFWGGVSKRPTVASEHCGRPLLCRPGGLRTPLLLPGLRALRTEGSWRAAALLDGWSPSAVTGNGGPRLSRWTRGRAVLSVATRGRPRQDGVPGSRWGRCAPRAPRVERRDAAPFGPIALLPWRGPPRFLDPRMWVRRAQAPPRGGRVRSPPGACPGRSSLAAREGPRSAPPAREPRGRARGPSGPPVAAGAGPAAPRSRRCVTAPESPPRPRPPPRAGSF